MEFLLVGWATYYTRGESPRTATRQLDYVFASRGFHESVRARALNEVNEWGPERPLSDADRG